MSSNSSCHRVYPHVCGETSLSQTLRSQNQGLSPRLWGNPIQNVAWACDKGSIPTHVGKPAHQSLRSRSRRVYPHACGETTSQFCGNISGLGLSPRMWGNLDISNDLFRRLGSIPTHVGKPRESLLSVIFLKVYPHACGETSSSHLAGS